MSLKELGNLGNFLTPPLFFWWIGTENRVLFDPKKVDFGGIQPLWKCSKMQIFEINIFNKTLVIWQSSCCQILMNLSQMLLMEVTSHLTPSPGQSGMSSKTPGRNLGGWVESWHGFWCQILMKLSQMPLMDVTSSLTPSPGQSGMSMSSKTPGRDLEDRWSLDMVSDVRSWWNFQRCFWCIFPPVWHHLLVNQECPCPPRLQEETWRIDGVLTWFLMSDLY